MRSDEGSRRFVARVRSPGGVFDGFQYLTPPLHSTSERQRGIADAVGQAAKAALRKANTPRTSTKASGTKVARRRGKAS
jgi:hypothetical protein